MHQRKTHIIHIINVILSSQLMNLMCFCFDSYMLYWAKRFSESPITEFCSVIKTNSTGPVGMYCMPVLTYIIIDWKNIYKQITSLLYDSCSIHITSGHSNHKAAYLTSFVLSGKCTWQPCCILYNDTACHMHLWPHVSFSLFEDCTS